MAIIERTVSARIMAEPELFSFFFSGKWFLTRLIPEPPVSFTAVILPAAPLFYHAYSDFVESSFNISLPLPGSAPVPSVPL